MTKLLSENEVANYRERGYHFPVNALSESEVAEFRGKLEDYEARTGGPIKGEMRHRSHVLFTWINEMIRHPENTGCDRGSARSGYPVLEYQLLHQRAA